MNITPYSNIYILFFKMVRFISVYYVEKLKVERTEKLCGDVFFLGYNHYKNINQIPEFGIETY